MTAHGAAECPAEPRRASKEFLTDLLLGAAVALTLTLFIVADVEHAQPDNWAYLWAVGFGALMFVRRAYPTLVVALSVIGFVSYYVVGFSSIGVAVPVAAAVFSAAHARKLAAAVGGSVVVVAISITYRLTSGQDPAFVLGYDLPPNLLILAAAIAFGDSLRSRSDLQRHTAEIEALTVERQRRRAEEHLAAERYAISRDLHDSIGHSLSVIALHSEVACEANADSDKRQHALEIVRATTSSALSELRRTVAGLRRGEHPPRQSFGLESLGVAVEPAEAAGVALTLEAPGHTDLPESIQTTIFRIVQESVTNIVRHSTATRAMVRVTVDQSRALVLIEDNGTRLAAEPRPGFGLLGMRERMERLGGTFGAHQTATGFRVEAELPLEDR